MSNREQAGLSKADLKPGFLYRIPGAWERGEITHKSADEMTRAELRSVLHDMKSDRAALANGDGK